MLLPKKLPLDLMQDRWASILNPFLSRPTNRMSLVKNIPILNGVNVINHGLGEIPQGWIITDVNGIASIYRSAPFNALTLTLTSDADVTLSLGVF